MSAKKLLWISQRLLVCVGLSLAASKTFAADHPIPVVHILAVDPCGSETGPDTATFAVYRDGPTNAPLTVDYRIGGTAQNGVDYQMLSGQVTITAGARRAAITVTPIDDSLEEGGESILIELVQPLSWPPPYIVCWPSFAFAHIEDNDTLTNRPPVVRLVSPPDGATFEAPVDITLVAAASDPDGRVRTVEFFDGTNSLGIVTNRSPVARPDPIDEAAAWEEESRPELFLNLAERPDLQPIPTAFFRLLWENVPPGEHGLTAVATDNLGASTRAAPVHIRVTPPSLQPIVTVEATDAVAAEGPLPIDPADLRSIERVNTATFTIRRTGPTDLPLTVYYRLTGSASNGLDYRELPHSVVIPVGARGAEVIIDPIDDNLVEGPEKVVLTVVPPICIAIFPPPPDCYLVGRPHAAEAVIHDNDLAPGNRPPVVEIVRPQDGDVFRAPADVAIVAQARDFDGRVVSVEFFEGTNSLGIVSNNPAVLSPTRPAFSLTWSNVPPGRYVLTAKATDDDGAMSRSRPVEIKVVGVTEPPMVCIEATDPEAAEGGNGILPDGSLSNVNTATFRVSRTGPTDRSLLVFYSLGGTALNGIDYRELSGRLTIPEGAVSAAVVIVPIDDRLFEGSESVVVTLEPSRCLNVSPAPTDCYRVCAEASARAVILDNDPAPPTNQPPRVAIVRPESGDIFTAPAEMVIYAEARDADGFVRTVEFFANGDSLGIVSNSLSSANTPVGEQIFRFAWHNVPAGAYALTAKATDNRGAMTTSEPVRIRVIEGSALPVVTIEAADPWASEGEREPTPVVLEDGRVAFIGPPIVVGPDTATFVVKRDRGTNVDLVVHYSLDGTAKDGVDYRSLPGQVTIPAGAHAARIVVSPIDDELVEGTETVIARLEPIACPKVLPPPPECYAVGEPGRAVAYIRDNDFENQAPRIEIAQPADGDVFAALADIAIVAAARDPDGWVEKVEFFEGTNKIGEDIIIFIQPPPPGQGQRFSIVWSNVPPGEYRLSARATDNRGATSRSESIAIKVTDRPEQPIVTVTAPDPRASEGGLAIDEWVDAAGVVHPVVDPAPNTATFTVRRSGPTNATLTVYYRLGGTASNGVDYRELPNTVVIPVGARSANVIVTPIDDNLPERLETVVLSLVEPPACFLDIFPPSPDCYLVGRPGAAEAIIYDNDAPANQPPFVRLNSPPDGAVFTAPADIILHAYAEDAEDGYDLKVEFFEGTNSLGFGTFVATLCPSPFCPFYALVWSNVPPGSYVLTAVATDSAGVASRSQPAEIKVVGASEPTVVNIVATDPEGREIPPLLPAIDDATFRVTRTGPTDAPLTVFYRLGGSAVNGVDYRRLLDEVTIPAGAAWADIVVVPLDDELCEGDESVIVRLVPPVCIAIFPPPPDCYMVGRDDVARAVIHDNEICPSNQPPRVAITSPHDGQVFEAPGQIPILALARDPDGWVPLVEFFADGRKIGEAIIVFIVPPPPGQTQEFTMRWLNVPPGRYRLTAKATDDRGAMGWSGPVDIVVQETPQIPVVTIVAHDGFAREGAPPNPATFVVRRAGPTNAPLTVHYAISGTAENGVDYQEIASHVTIPAGRRAARIVITPKDDRQPERIETVVLRLHPAALYNVGRPGAAAAVICDNDAPRPGPLALADRLFHLRLDGPDGLCYRIEASGDLQNWEPLCSCAMVEGALHFVDPDAAGHPKRFYRCVRDVFDAGFFEEE